MSMAELLKVVGLGAAAIILGLEGLHWLQTRRLWPRIGFHQHLKEVLFFPSPLHMSLPHGRDTPFSRLLEHLLSASATLDVCMFSFSSTELSRAVQLLHNRGVRNAVLVDRDFMAITGSQIGALRKAGICVRHELVFTMHMHHKFALLDSRKLITGSLNWTTTAVQSNNENVIVTEEPELVRPYEREFNVMWEANNPVKHLPHSKNYTKALLAPSKDERELRVQ